MQSGSDDVLRRMNRPYSSHDYRERVEEVRSRFPDAAIGADIIVGFPGETEAEFQETLELAESLPLTYLHGERRALTLKQQTAGGRRVALAGNYMEVRVPADEVEENRIVAFRVTGRGPQGRWEARCG